MVQQLLYKYLVLNGRLGLPDIGSFTIHRQSATVDETGTTLLSPVHEVRFEQQPVQADKNLFLFLAQETDSDEVSSIGFFNEWVKSTKEKLVQETMAELPYIGSLHATPGGTYRFEAVSPSMGLQSVDLPAGIAWNTITTEEEPMVESTDSGWWIYAIILLLLGIAAIAYRYL